MLRDFVVKKHGKVTAFSYTIRILRNFGIEILWLFIQFYFF